MGFGEHLDDALIVLDVGKRQRAALAVFQPFLRGLVAAYVEVPRHLRHAFKALVGVDPDLHGFGIKFPHRRMH